MSLYGNEGNVSSANKNTYLKLGKDTIKVQGIPGISAYEVALENGYVGTEAQWLASLVGATGAQGPLGSPMSVWVGSQSSYNALGTWDNSTLYFIV